LALGKHVTMVGASEGDKTDYGYIERKEEVIKEK
jgi:hypothetical protein